METAPATVTVAGMVTLLAMALPTLPATSTQPGTPTLPVMAVVTVSAMAMRRRE
jgi:uncharacterized protein (TIGR03382 family)